MGSEGPTATTGPGRPEQGVVGRGRSAEHGSLWRLGALVGYVVVACAILYAARPSFQVDVLRLDFAGSGERAGALLYEYTSDAFLRENPNSIPLPPIEEVGQAGDDGVQRALEAEVRDLVEHTNRALHDDGWPFIPLYALLLAAPLGLLVFAAVVAGPEKDMAGDDAQGSRPRITKIWHSWVIAGAVAIAAVGVAVALDYLENAALRTGLDELVRQVDDVGLRALTTAETGSAFETASLAAGLKFALLLMALATLVLMSAAWVRSKFGPPQWPPPPLPRPRSVAASWTPRPHKVGVSCSGGGVRSATFCLGALQVLDEHDVLEKARYVTAVSGGGYMAASWAIANGETDAALKPTPPASADAGASVPATEAPRRARIFAPRSPEEKWVRLHSSHLVGSPMVLLAGALRLVAGVLFGWFLIWLLMFAVARPLGWIISSAPVHPELRARTPILETVSQPRFTDTRVTLIEENTSADPPYATYSFTPIYAPAVFRSWGTTTADSFTIVEAPLTSAGGGVVRVERSEASIVEQPSLEVTPEDQPCTWPGGPDTAKPSSPNADGPCVVISTNAEFELDSRGFRTVPLNNSPIEVAIQRSLTEETAPTVTHRSGMTGRTSIDIGLGQWLAGLLLLTSGFALYLSRVLWRPFRTSVRHTLEEAAAMLSLTGAVWLVVLVVLPWCVQEVPPFLGELLHVSSDKGGASGDGATGLDGLIAALGITGLLATAVRSFMKLAVSSGKAHLGTFAKFAIGVVLPLAGALFFLDLLEFATANGPSGDMLGFGLGMSLAALPQWIVADLARWCWVFVMLGALATVDAHSWSLFPFYKRRLSEAYVVRRDGEDSASEVRYEDGPTLIVGTQPEMPESRKPHGQTSRHPGAEPTGAETGAPTWWATLRRRHRAHRQFRADAEERSRTRDHDRLVGVAGSDESNGGHLVMCCAANVTDRSVAPPGRRSVSFTISDEVVGSEELGWMATRDYIGRLGQRRLSDVTLPSMMAISGAAVSPGMGKMSRGPIDSLLALLNVRLGVWLPNPSAVEAESNTTWKRRPWWRWYLYEVVGYFPRSGPFLYVSDGGHWENLGLVELFRRGCTDIYCISAAGDGPESFSTIGEAIALVREQFGIDIDIDLSALRRPARAPASVKRSLRRRSNDTTEGTMTDSDWASAAFVRGTFSYPDHPDVKGRLVVIEANLTRDIPWDVQTWAEASVEFPDDPTTDQLFSHRQFESYRALGRHQMIEALRPSSDGPSPDRNHTKP